MFKYNCSLLPTPSLRLHWHAAVFFAALLPAIFVTPLSAAPLNPNTVYADALRGGWQNWSWDTAIEPSATTPVRSGNYALSVKHDAAWAGLYLHSTVPLASSSYDTLRSWIHGGDSGGQSVVVKLADSNNAMLDSNAAAVGSQSALRH